MDRASEPAGTGSPETGRELVVPEHLGRTPVVDPGLGPHLPRLSDVDAGAAHRATRQVATLFGLVPLFALAFVVIYFAVPSNTTLDVGFLHTDAQHVGLGVTFAACFALVGLGAVQWARQVMVDREMVEERHGAESSPVDRAAVVRELQQGVAESEVPRRKVLGLSLLGALGVLVLPVLTLFADLGPWPTKKVRATTLEQTIWAEGVRLVEDVTYQPIKAADLLLGQLVNAEPENLQQLSGTELLQAKAKAAILVVRIDPNSLKVPPSREDWDVDGILCYSKICTHVGCPVSLYEQESHHLLCPCHQSTFDLADAGRVLFGPAARRLPQLPITTDAEGFLIARSDFLVPVGASFFERNAPSSYPGGDL